MAFGQSDVAGVFALPDVPALGPGSWDEMSGMSPGHALVGGALSGDNAGYGSGHRQVAVGQSLPLTAVQSAAPVASHWSQLFNLKGNPIGWVLLAALGYWALNFIHFNAGASAGAHVGVKR